MCVSKISYGKLANLGLADFLCLNLSTRLINEEDSKADDDQMP